MKRYINANKSYPIYIDIVLTFDTDAEILGSSKNSTNKPKAEKPVDDLTYLERKELIGDEVPPSNQDFELSPEAQFGFNQFIGFFDGLLNEYQFEVKEDYASTQSSSSYYFSFFGANSDGDLVYNKLYIARISTHIKEDAYDPVNFYRRTAEKYKTPNTKRKQGYMPIKIQVNNEEYTNYREACKAVEDTIKVIQADCDTVK